MKNYLSKAGEFLKNAPSWPGKIKDGFVNAVANAKMKIAELPKEEQGSLWAKLNIWIDSFREEMAGVKEEKEGVKKKTEKETAEKTDAKVEEVKAVAKLDEAVEGEEKNVFDETMALVQSSAQQNLNAEQGKAFNAALEKVADPEKGSVSGDEFLSTTGVAFVSLHGIKQIHGSKPELVKYFTSLQAATDKSALSRLFTPELKQVFSLGLGDVRPVLGALGMDPSDALKLKGIAERPIADENEVVEVLREKKIASKNTRPVMRAINALIVDGATPANLAELVYEMDERDMLNIAGAFLGKDATAIKTIEIPSSK